MKITESFELPAGEPVSYSFQASRWGELLIASTREGICYLTFVLDSRADALARLAARFPHACLEQKTEALHLQAAGKINEGRELWQEPELPIHLVGTQLQIFTWEAIMQIPRGVTVSYSMVAARAGYAPAVRAVATAVSRNPIAILIPCHRVLSASSLDKPLNIKTIGKYFFSPELKLKLLRAEM